MAGQKQYHFINARIFDGSGSKPFAGEVLVRGSTIESVIRVGESIQADGAAATRHGGALMGLPVGEIKPGKLADLLLVEGDPSADVTLLQNKSNLRAIMKDGRFFKSPAIH